jgi:hypothetical protein
MGFQVVLRLVFEVFGHGADVKKPRDCNALWLAGACGHGALAGWMQECERRVLAANAIGPVVAKG